MVARNGAFWRCLAFIAVIHLLVSDQRCSGASHHSLKNVPTCPTCNIVFVSFDTLRADYRTFLPRHGTLMPTVDTLAKRGITFTQAISASSWTLPATMSWFTGVYPSRHQVTNKYLASSIDDGAGEIMNLHRQAPELVTLASVLRDHSYRTGGFTGGAGVHHQFGFDQGFEVYVDDGNFEGLRDSGPKAIAWITEHQSEKFFVFLHGYDCHGQYQPPGGLDHRYVSPNYRGSYAGTNEEQKALREEGLEKEGLFLANDDVEFWKGLYAEKVERADQAFAQFIDAYRRLGLMDKTIFVITSDHGEEFMEHGRLDHGPTLYEEVVRVPLILIIPGLARPMTVERQARSIDLMPTLLTLAEIAPSARLTAQLQGRDILHSDADVSPDAIIETEYRYYTFLRGVREEHQPRWKLIVNREFGTQELFCLSRDPRERRNLRAASPETTGRLAEKLNVH